MFLISMAQLLSVVFNNINIHALGQSTISLHRSPNRSLASVTNSAPAARDVNKQLFGYCAYTHQLHGRSICSSLLTLAVSANVNTNSRCLIGFSSTSRGQWAQPCGMASPLINQCAQFEVTADYRSVGLERRTRIFTNQVVVFLLSEGSHLVFVPQLLLRAGDVESNPGPGPVTRSIVTKARCNACSNPIRRGMDPISCAVANCTNKCHKQKACSKLHRSQIGTNWLCSTHSVNTGQENSAPIILPGSAGGRCDACGVKFRANTSSLTCSTGGCGKRCHKATRCSTISRYSVNTAKWSCSDHCQHRTVTVAGRPVDDLQPSSCTSSSAASTTERRTCNHCKKTIAKRGTAPLSCRVCKASFHNCCSGLSRDTLRSVIDTDSWTCPVCAAKPLQQSAQSSFSQAVAQPKDHAEPKESSTAKNSLRILQWNADGIKPKLHELEMRMRELDIDVAIIQETKLKKADRSPTVPGYATIRCDRPGETAGGGLISYIKHSLTFREDSRRTTADTVTPEVSSFYVKATRHRWLNIVNCYIPPTRTVANAASPTPITSLDFLPSTEDTLVGGDLNAHSNLWDFELTAEVIW